MSNRLSEAALAAAAAVLCLPLAALAGKPPRVLSKTQIEVQNLVVKPELPAAQGKRAATKLVYLMVDNNLQGLGRATLEKLKDQGKLAPTAHSLVFFDSTELGAALWNLGDKPQLTAAVSPLSPRLQRRVPSNSIPVMSKVFRWAFDTYPADRRYLEIYSHGAGVKGVGSDEHDSPYKDDLVPIQGLARALRDGGNGKPFDMVFFTACLMANIEALYEIAPSARYVVASELPINGDLTGTVVVDSPLLFEKLIRDGLPPDQIARTLAKSMSNKQSDGVDTIVAMDLTKMGALVKQLASFVKALLALPMPEKVKVRQALSASRVGKPGWAVGDLWKFARGVQQTVKDEAVQREVRALFRSQAAATLFERNKEKNGTGGLSFHLPSDGLFRGYAKSRFARDTGWDRMLTAMAQAQ